MSKKIDSLQTTYRQFSLRNLYYVLFRHKGKMLLFFGVVIATATLAILQSPTIYRSEAQLLVRLGRESVTLDPTATTGQIIPVSESRERQINTELALLESCEIIERAVEVIDPEVLLHEERTINKAASQLMISKIKGQLGIALERLLCLIRDPNQTFLDNSAEAVRLVMANFYIESQRDSSTINLAYESRNPILAQKILTQLIESYLQKHISVHRTAGSYKFFAQQSDDLQKKLIHAERELLDVRNKMGISSPKEQQQIVLNRIGNLKQQIGLVEAELSVSRAKVQAMQETLADISEVVVNEETAGFSDYGADLMRARLFELQMKAKSLTSKYTEESRQVQMIRQELAEAQALFDKEKINSIRKQVQLDLFAEQVTRSSLESHVEHLKGQLTKVQAELKTVNDADFKITQLTREIDIHKANYQKYSDSLEQSRIDDALEMGNISNIRIVQSATLPIKPVRPRGGLNLALGILLGIFGAIVLAFFSEYLDHSIKMPEELEDKLQLAPLVSIPYISTYSLTQKTKIASCRRATETLKEKLLLSFQGSHEPRVFAITSFHRNEGVSQVTANLAISLAQLDQGKTLLIDANLCYPSVHETFNINLLPGLAGALTNGSSNDNVILFSSLQNLHVLPAGKTEDNLSEIVDADKVRRLLDSIKTNYRFVVIDLPALSETSWVIRLVNLCDGICLVVEAERSRWEVVDSAKDLLLQANANILGVILNKRRFYIPNWVYKTL